MDDIETAKRHCRICGAEVEAPVDTLGALAKGPRIIAEAVRGTTAGSRERWSPAEVAAHLADTEIVTGWRLRQILAEDEPNIDPYDQERWAAALAYERRNVELALETFAVLRRANLEALARLTEAEWARGYHHPEYGHLTLRELIAHKSDHDLAHLRQIQGA